MAIRSLPHAEEAGNLGSGVTPIILSPISTSDLKSVQQNQLSTIIACQLLPYRQHVAPGGKGHRDAVSIEAKNLTFW